MSYIRSISNPEKLYIWSESDNRLAICTSPGNIQYMPTNIFESLIKRWIRAQEELWYTDDDIKWKGARLREVFVGVSMLDLIEKESAGKKITKEEWDQCSVSRFVWRLTYKNIQVDMYHSTLFYLAYHNPRRFGWEFKKMRKRRKK